MTPKLMLFQPLRVAGPSDAVDEFMNHDAHNRRNEQHNPCGRGAKKLTDGPAIVPNQEKQSGERDAHHTHDDNGKDVCLDQVDGYFPSVAAFNLLERRLFLLDVDILSSSIFLLILLSEVNYSLNNRWANIVR